MFKHIVIDEDFLAEAPIEDLRAALSERESAIQAGEIEALTAEVSWQLGFLKASLQRRNPRARAPMQIAEAP